MAAVTSIADFVNSRGPHPPHRQSMPGSSDLDLLGPAPVGSSDLDLSGPARASSDSDLSGPAAGSAGLDLSRAPAVPPRPAAVPTSRPVRPVPRTRSGERTQLTPKAPTVTLNRLQSGIGVLSVEAACSDAVGDLRIGCAYELADGHTSTVQRAGGSSTAPKDSRRPIIAGRRDQFERLMLDLRQSRQLERLVVYGFSESGAPLRWGGTLIVTTAGGARIELPLDRPPSAGVTVFLSIYNVRGEFVIRAEMEIIAGSVRDAVKAYGFNRISWLDERTPIA
jgi:uncharacterized protein involved in tellurium resistance